MRQVLTLAIMLLLLSPCAAAAQTGPQLTVTAPANEATIESANVSIEFQVEGLNLVPSTVPLAEAGKRPEADRPGEGHLHFMLDLQPLVVWERETPYTFENVPPGEHQLVVELVNNDHSPLSPPVVQQVRFRTSMLMPQTGTLDGWWQPLRSTLFVIAALLVSVGFVIGRKHTPRKHRY